jgi:hypothetical protein
VCIQKKDENSGVISIISERKKTLIISRKFDHQQQNKPTAI